MSDSVMELEAFDAKLARLRAEERADREAMRTEIHAAFEKVLQRVLVEIRAEFARVDKRIDALEARVERLEARFNELHWWFAGHLAAMLLGMFGIVWGVQQSTVQSFQAGGADQKTQQAVQSQVQSLTAQFPGLQTQVQEMGSKAERLTLVMERLDRRIGALEAAQAARGAAPSVSSNATRPPR